MHPSHLSLTSVSLCVCVYVCVRYVDVILQCISLAGDFVTEDIWYRVVQIVTNHEDLQEYAASTCYKFLEASNVHENGVKVAAYILGEFGDQIKDPAITGAVLFDLLHSKFRTSGNSTKALLLSAYIKMANTYPELKDRYEQQHSTPPHPTAPQQHTGALHSTTSPPCASHRPPPSCFCALSESASFPFPTAHAHACAAPIRGDMRSREMGSCTRRAWPSPRDRARHC